MKTPIFPLWLVALGLGISLSGAQEVPMKAEFEAKLAEAVARKDWKAVENLSIALQRLEDAAGTVGQPAAPPEPGVPPKLGKAEIKSLSERGFSLSLAPGDDNPARFAFARDIQAGTDTQFSADFFLSWQLPDSVARDWGMRRDDWAGDVGASVEGKLSAGNAEDLDSWRFRVEYESWHLLSDSQGGGLSALEWKLSLKDEANRDFDYNRLSGEFWLTPSDSRLAMGVYQPGPTGGEGDQVTLPPVQFRWRPFVGVDAGGITDGEELAPDAADDALWLMGRATAKLRLNFLSEAMNLAEVSLFADDKIIYANEEEDWHNYLIAGANFMINRYAGFTFSWTKGEESPKFADEERLEGAFSIRF